MDLEDVADAVIFLMALGVLLYVIAKGLAA
jgi:hypothetical protein